MTALWRTKARCKWLSTLRGIPPCRTPCSIDAGGKLLCKNLRSVDMLELRRTILAYLPSDYIGFNQYWLAGAAPKQPEKSGR